jgi:hypothetical protein
MDTYFIRHTRELDIDDKFRKRLWELKCIAVHYPNDKNGKLPDRDNSSLDSTDYDSKSSGIIQRLNELANSGGYVCAQYYPQEGCLIGKVLPNSTIELLYGKWGLVSGLSGREAILKALPLGNVKYLSPLESAAILVCRPKQGTLLKWHKIGKRIENLVEGRNVAFSLHDLLPSQQEIMCSEFLRLEKASEYGLPRLAHLVFPPGRTMKDIDIIGISTRKNPLLAQVTYAAFESSHWKIDRLRKYGNGSNTDLVLFCSCKDPFIENGVHVFPLERVFDFMMTLDTGRKMLEFE